MIAAADFRIDLERGQNRISHTHSDHLARCVGTLGLSLPRAIQLIEIFDLTYEKDRFANFGRDTILPARTAKGRVPDGAQRLRPGAIQLGEGWAMNSFKNILLVCESDRVHEALVSGPVFNRLARMSRQPSLNIGAKRSTGDVPKMAPTG